MRPLATALSRRVVALSLVATSLGCSPLLYALLSARSDEGGEIVPDHPVRGSTSHSADSYAVECAGEDGEDAAWRFVPPVTGRWRVHVTGDYDTVVAVFEDGHQIACNDDFGSTRVSQVDTELTAGQAYTLVVDGYHGADGAFEMTVTPTPAETTTATTPTPEADGPTHAARCETAPYLNAGVSTGSLGPLVATTHVSCGSRGPGGEALYRYVVEAPGTLLVSEASDFDAIVEIRGGCASNERVAACGDDVPDVRHSGANAHLTPGVYYLVVDGYAANAEGRFTLQTSWHPDTVALDLDIATDVDAAVVEIASDDAGTDAGTDARTDARTDAGTDARAPALRRIARDGGARP